MGGHKKNRVNRHKEKPADLELLNGALNKAKLSKAAQTGSAQTVTPKPALDLWHYVMKVVVTNTNLTRDESSCILQYLIELLPSDERSATQQQAYELVSTYASKTVDKLLARCSADPAKHGVYTAMLTHTMQPGLDLLRRKNTAPFLLIPCDSIPPTKPSRSDMVLVSLWNVLHYNLAIATYPRVIEELTARAQQQCSADRTAAMEHYFNTFYKCAESLWQWEPAIACSSNEFQFLGLKLVVLRNVIFNCPVTYLAGLAVENAWKERLNMPAFKANDQSNAVPSGASSLCVGPGNGKDFIPSFQHYFMRLVVLNSNMGRPEKELLMSYVDQPDSEKKYASDMEYVYANDTCKEMVIDQIPEPFARYILTPESQPVLGQLRNQQAAPLVLTHPCVAKEQLETVTVSLWDSLNYNIAIAVPAHIVKQQRTDLQKMYANNKQGVTKDYLMVFEICAYTLWMGVSDTFQREALATYGARLAILREILFRCPLTLLSNTPQSRMSRQSLGAIPHLAQGCMVDSSLLLEVETRDEFKLPAGTLVPVPLNAFSKDMIVGVSTEGITQPATITYGVVISHLSETVSRLRKIHQASPSSLEQILQRSFLILGKHQLDMLAVSGEDAGAVSYLAGCSEISMCVSVCCYILYNIPIRVAVNKDPFVYAAIVSGDTEVQVSAQTHLGTWEKNFKQLATAAKKAGLKQYICSWLDLPD